eukprot:scaffold20659_cov64-Phaeocystis_antarctica.AAC.9
MTRPAESERRAYDAGRGAGLEAGGRLEGVMAQGLAICGTRQGAGRTQLESGGRAWVERTLNM